MGAQDPAAPRQQQGAEPRPARRLGGRYELGAVIGSGGMAVVRAATDLRLGRTVAVKMLRGELTESPAFRERFRREARAAAALNHPAIVGVYDAGDETVDGVDTCYIVMEYVEGQTLRDLIRSGPQSLRRALQITAGVLDALAESHRCGIVHRDVKPANVMVTSSGAVKVMDFGVARAVGDVSAALTRTATVIGTAHYLSPEQARGDSVDARSDVYSTGCLLYELLTGHPPFEGDSAVAVAYQHVREDPRPPSESATGVAPDVDSVVLAALAKRPDQRYQSAQQMRDAITAVLAGEQAPVPSAPPETTAELPLVTDPVGPGPLYPSPAATDLAASVPVAAGRRPLRRRRPVVAAAAGVLVLGLGGLAFVMLGDDPETGPQTGQRAARGDEGGPRLTRQAQTEPAQAEPAQTEPGRPAGSTAREATPAGRFRQLPGAGDGRADEAPGETADEPAVQNSRSVDPPARTEADTSDPPASAPTAGPTTPQQTTPSEPEPSETAPSETTPPAEPVTESPEPPPTASEEPPPPTSPSPDESSSTS